MARINTNLGKLRWPASTSTDVVKYRIYIKPDSPIVNDPASLDQLDYEDVGVKLEVEIKDLSFEPSPSGVAYYGVTAWDTSDHESDVRQVEAEIDATPPEAPATLEYILPTI